MADVGSGVGPVVGVCGVWNGKCQLAAQGPAGPPWPANARAQLRHSPHFAMEALRIGATAVADAPNASLVLAEARALLSGSAGDPELDQAGGDGEAQAAALCWLVGRSLAASAARGGGGQAQGRRGSNHKPLSLIVAGTGSK